MPGLDHEEINGGRGKCCELSFKKKRRREGFKNSFDWCKITESTNKNEKKV